MKILGFASTQQVGLSCNVTIQWPALQAYQMGNQGICSKE